MNSTNNALGELNLEVVEAYDKGEPFTANLRSVRPIMRVLSIDPLVYESYGRFRNRPPSITGRIALRGFLSKDSPNNSEYSYIYGLAEAGPELYGIPIHDVKFLRDIAKLAGREDIYFFDPRTEAPPEA